MALWLALLSPLPGCNSMADSSTAAFDSESWKALPAAHQPPFARREMADALVSERLLHGRDRAAVEALLGPADETTKFSDYDLVYWLGPERAFIAADSEWLVIRFDGSGIVSEYEVKTD